MDQLSELAETALEDSAEGVTDGDAEGISAESLLALSSENAAEDSGVEGENSIDSTAQEALLAELEQKESVTTADGEEEEPEMQLKMEDDAEEYLSGRDADIDADTADSNVSQFGDMTGDENTADFSEAVEGSAEEASSGPVDSLKLTEGVLDELSQESLGSNVKKPSLTDELKKSEISDADKLLQPEELMETNDSVPSDTLASGEASSKSDVTGLDDAGKADSESALAETNDAIIMNLSDLLNAKQTESESTASVEGTESESVTMSQEDTDEGKNADNADELLLLAAIKEEAEAALSSDGSGVIPKEVSLEPEEKSGKAIKQENLADAVSVIPDKESLKASKPEPGKEKPEFFDKPVFYDKPEIKSTKLPDDTGIATDALATLASAALGCEARSNGISKSDASDPSGDASETELIPPPKPEANPWCDVGIINGTSCVVTKFFQTNITNEHNELTVEDLPSFINIPHLSLEPGTAYKFRVAAINTCGRGPWSEMSAFKTCLPGYPGAPSAIKISRSSDGVHLSWEPPSSTCGKIIEYAVCLAVKSNQPPQVDPKVKAPPPQLSFVRVYCGPNNQAVVPNSSLSAAHIDTTTKPAIIFRIAAKNDKGYGPATQVRWLQDIASTPTGSKVAPKREPAISPTSAAKKLRVE